MRFENTKIYNFDGAFRGMRNPLNSWSKSDSDFSCERNPILGENDLKLAQRLIKAGNEHRKFLRQIVVSVDITAPLYFWKEWDTYKVGTVANSTSTMHKIASTPITLDCFELDDYKPSRCSATINGNKVDFIFGQLFVDALEQMRQNYNKTKDKALWKELIRWLPEGWLQKRTVTLNYENILSMIRQRKFHKLNEWSGCDNPTKINFLDWAKTLPYAEELLFITDEEAEG